MSSPDVTIRELQARKATLERDLASAVAPLLHGFQEETGVEVTDVFVDLTKIETIGEARRTIVSRVQVGIHIGAFS